jgi:hypothetical protein
LRDTEKNSSNDRVTFDAEVVNRRLCDSVVALLRDGDVALRMGKGADSYMLAHMNRKNTTYSHCGIVLLEHGYPFVYHSIGGEDNPDERLRRDSACLFFSQRHNTGIGIAHYEYSGDQMAALRRRVAWFYKARPKFDLKFDLATDDKLYCTEFVYKAMNQAVGDTTYIKTTTFLGHRFVGTDDLFINNHAQLSCGVVYR